MLTAVVLHPPKFGATPAAVDDRAALAEPGVTAVVPIEEGVAVVGETFDDAQRGLRALRVRSPGWCSEAARLSSLSASSADAGRQNPNAMTARTNWRDDVACLTPTQTSSSLTDAAAAAVRASRRGRPSAVHGTCRTS